MASQKINNYTPNQTLMPKQLPTSKNDGKPVFARLAKFTHNQFHCSLRSPQTNNIPSILIGQRKTTQIDAPKIACARVRLAGLPHLPPLSSPPPPTSHIGVRNLIMFIFNHGDVPVPLTFMGAGVSVVVPLPVENSSTIDMHHERTNRATTQG